jgi:hypothetical protein
VVAYWNINVRRFDLNQFGKYVYGVYPKLQPRRELEVVGIPAYGYVDRICLFEVVGTLRRKE